MSEDTNTHSIDLSAYLYSFEKPGRYVGGEKGALSPISTLNQEDFNIALCFPDLYEIGMSNNAMRILYDRFNRIEHIRCERVFAPAQDLEQFLTEKKLPLFSLESKFPIHGFDLLAFSVGYELSFTNIFTVLNSSLVPLKSEDRTEAHPIVIGGGPALTNPAPFGPFLDAVYIGESEEEFERVLVECASIKSRGGSREEILAILSESKAMWTKHKPLAIRAIYKGFAREYTKAHLIVPSIKTVQDHNVIEIMRGCPNGCRFCHAGYFYRPVREKGMEDILKETDGILRATGIRSLTLSSLSTGDYHGIEHVLKKLDQVYSQQHIGFSLPSIKINSFNLDLLKSLSTFKNSGLTFAVETPSDFGQKVLNKEVSKDKIIEILLDAKEKGWKLVKMYFMVGLPIQQEEKEEELIVDFLKDVQKRTKLQINVNVGTFIPKPHSPFQWARQISEEESLEKIFYIKRNLDRRHFRFGYHAPFTSLLEGIIARGDERAGYLALAAWGNGARFDAWEEHFSMEIWRQTLENADTDFYAYASREIHENESLPWDGISIGVSKKFLLEEWNFSQQGSLRSICDLDCAHNCGVCRPDSMVHNQESESDFSSSLFDRVGSDSRVVFSFTKSGPAIYWSHKNLMDIFDRAFIRAGYKTRMSQGFKPKLKFEIASPLGLGISSEGELAAVELLNFNEDFIQLMNDSLPQGMEILEAEAHEYREAFKPKSLMSRFTGSIYTIDADDPKLIPGIIDLITEEPTITDIQSSESRITIEVTGQTNVRKLIDPVAHNQKVNICRQKIMLTPDVLPPATEPQVHPG
jgi:radical SAM-linked protein